MYEIEKAAIFCDDVDGKTLQQFRECLSFEWAIQGALMPDAHLGYSMPIGGVIETERIVVPAWVGYDIGCGVCAVPTDFKKEDIYDYATPIYEAVKEAVPMGFAKHDTPIAGAVGLKLTAKGKELYYKRDGDHQVGTLGGGNHFIEICRDEDDKVWFVIHSGSRGVGHEIGGHYMKLAKDHGVNSLGLTQGSRMFKDYTTDMNYCLKWALHNRNVMLFEIEKAINKILPGFFHWDQLINKNHNHAEVYWKEGEGAVRFLHRKGATTASEGTLGVIPGNMADGSYIVEGLGNPQSLYSCSHGAGRRMSRSKAKSELELADFQLRMMNVYADVSQRTIDESPGAYKNFESVMDQQEDLCKIVHKLTPIINWKG